MKNERILSIIVFLLVLVVGFQGYYMYKINSTVPVIKKELIVTPKIDNFSGVNPFEQMHQMQKKMDRIFNTMNSSFSSMPEFEEFFKDMSISPSINIKDLKDKYEISMDLPGSSEQNIKISVDDRVLKVEAKTQKLSDSNTSNFIKKERYEGSFVKSITLPNDAKGGEFTSEFKNGVLKIVVPKAQ